AYPSSMYVTFCPIISYHFILFRCRHLLYYLTFYSFFFYCSVAHLDLPSFPTRRSSDLRFHFIVALEEIILHLHHVVVTPRNHLRSEEHTSELQSRFDLVCRLLLEKKNEVTTTHKSAIFILSPLHQRHEYERRYRNNARC